MHKPLLGCLGLLALLSSLSPAPESKSAAPPTWFLEHLEAQMLQGGLSIADNADYQGAGEPAEAYAVQWRWGPGKQSLIGRLHAIVRGQAQADAWQLRSFWHPGQRAALVLQYGADGSYAEGQLRPLGEGGTQLEQTFFAPDGGQLKVRHENSALVNGEHEASSFVRVGDAWQLDRTYIWLLPEAPEEEQD